MGRVLLIFAALLAAVAFLAITASFLRSLVAGTRLAGQRHPGIGKDGAMTPTTLQKVAYSALLALLIGVTTGWLGGL